MAKQLAIRRAACETTNNSVFRVEGGGTAVCSFTMLSHCMGSEELDAKGALEPNTRIKSICIHFDYVA